MAICKRGSGDSPNGLFLFLGRIQVSLKTSALGNSVEEVEQLIWKHENFQKVLTAQDKKVMSLGSAGHCQSWWEEGRESGNFGESKWGKRGAWCVPRGHVGVTWGPEAPGGG